MNLCTVNLSDSDTQRRRSTRGEEDVGGGFVQEEYRRSEIRFHKEDSATQRRGQLDIKDVKRKGAVERKDGGKENGGIVRNVTGRTR